MKAKRNLSSGCYLKHYNLDKTKRGSETTCVSYRVERNNIHNGFWQIAANNRLLYQTTMARWRVRKYDGKQLKNVQLCVCVCKNNDMMM